MGKGTNGSTRKVEDSCSHSVDASLHWYLQAHHEKPLQHRLGHLKSLQGPELMLPAAEGHLVKPTC